MILRAWEPPPWMVWLIVVVFAPLWAPAVAYWWLEGWLRKGKRHIFGPRVGEYQRWFAWHPVALDNGWGPTVWLETVERQALGTSYDYGIAYRPTNQEHGEG